ncbi:MAG: hypothetical protein AAFQ42_06395, partial [Pseudomonadota bacterium]
MLVAAETRAARELPVRARVTVRLQPAADLESAGPPGRDGKLVAVRGSDGALAISPGRAGA